MTTVNCLITSQIHISASVKPVAAMPGYSTFEITETDSQNKYGERVVYSVVLEADHIDALLRSFARLQQNEIHQTT